MYFTKLLEDSEVLEFFGIFKKKKKVKYETTEQERRQAISVAKTAARNAISKLDAKAKRAVSVSVSNTKEFISGEEDWCLITSWDLWKYNPKARTDEDTNNVFYDILFDIQKSVNEELKTKTKDKFVVDESGDWDGGGLELLINSYEVEE